MTRLVECLRCGRSNPFAPGQVESACSQCEVSVPIPARLEPEIAEHDVDEAPQMLPLHRSASLCERSNTVLSGLAQATTCPSCGSSTRPLSPPPECVQADGLLPFIVRSAEARVALDEALCAVFEEAPRILGVRSLFAPWWILSWDTRTAYKGQRGITERNGKGPSRTIWSEWSGEVERPWPHVERSASALLPEEMTARLSPWDWPFAEPYRETHLDGESSAHSPIQATDVMAGMMREIDAEIRAAIVDDIGGDRQRISSVSTELFDRRYRLVLVPLWIATLSDGKRAAVNGRTGEVVIEGCAALQITDDDRLDRAPTQTLLPKIIVGSVMLLIGIVIFNMVR